MWIIEELLFRGLLQHTFTETMGACGIFVVSAIFSILHLGNSWHDCLFAAVVGVMYALVVKNTGSIYGVSISHGLIKAVLILVMPYLALLG
jgi:membrane protease YdiL (CAAX protease family)